MQEYRDSNSILKYRPKLIRDLTSKLHSSSVKPERYQEYSGLRALVSNKYIRLHYSINAVDSPSLSVLDADIIAKLSSNDINRMKERRHLVVVLGGLIIAYSLYSSRLRIDSSLHPYLQLVGAAVVIGLEYLMLWELRRSASERIAADLLFYAIIVLEQNADRWSDAKFRWEYAARLARLAKTIERVPVTLKGVAPVIRKDALKVSRAKAQAVRDLEVWAITPGPFTFTDLAARLVSDLCLMVDGRWYDLPEAEYVPQTSRWAHGLRVGSAIIAIGGAAVFIGLAAKLGPVASILATVLIATAVGLFNVSGIPVGLLERYARTGTDMLSIR